MATTWQVIVLPGVDKRVAHLSNPDRRRIQAAINALADGPYNSSLDIKKLKGRPEWRIRIGSWRILFLVDSGIVTITVISVDSRGDVY